MARHRQVPARGTDSSSTSEPIDALIVTPRRRRVHWAGSENTDGSHMASQSVIDLSSRTLDEWELEYALPHVEPASETPRQPLTDQNQYSMAYDYDSESDSERNAAVNFRHAPTRKRKKATKAINAQEAALARVVELEGRLAKSKKQLATSKKQLARYKKKVRKSKTKTMEAKAGVARTHNYRNKYEDLKQRLLNHYPRIKKEVEVIDDRIIACISRVSKAIQDSCALVRRLNPCNEGLLKEIERLESDFLGHNDGMVKELGERIANINKKLEASGI